MDRISALRNIEEALSEFEAGTADLESVQRRVVTVIGTYATEFETDELATYRATAPDRATGLVVVAGSPEQARDRIVGLLDDERVQVTVDRVD